MANPSNADFVTVNTKNASDSKNIPPKTILFHYRPARNAKK